MHEIERTGNRPLFLGIDTGGTYTDAVLYAETVGVTAKAKALTTRHDLAIGITEAAERVLAGCPDPRSIALVSMSTTLATNALVEGQGGRVALVMIGFEPGDLEKDGLSQAIATDPVIFCKGGHDVHGNAMPLDLAPLQAALAEGLGEQVIGAAVAGYFATRNPAHELAARSMLEDAGLPVTCSHELTSKLGGPRRALTTLLNARLVPLITRLIDATQDFMQARSIDAPLMVVRGDGALIASEMARQRPIETILSGPAASLVGARELTGADNAFVSDIGGTTTDIALLDQGRPRLDPEGATVGGFRTMVEAVAMRTYGLGGDSEVTLEEGTLDPVLRLGPRRVVPLSLAGHLHGAGILSFLERELAESRPGRHDGRLVMRTGVPYSSASGLTPSASRLLDEISEKPAPLGRLLISSIQLAPLAHLVRRGLVQIIGFTPSDAAHVLALQTNWNRDCAILGARLLARRQSGRGQPIAKSPEEISERVLQALQRRTAEALIETALIEDGLDGPGLVHSPLVMRALDGTSGTARSSIALDRLVIGLGASARVHYAGLQAKVGSECLVPENADVANALGAVAGQVRATAEAIVTQPVEGLFRVAVGENLFDFREEQAALRAAEATATDLARKRAVEAGTDAPSLSLTHDIHAAEVEGRRMFVEAHITATASGRPRIAFSAVPSPVS